MHQFTLLKLGKANGRAVDRVSRVFVHGWAGQNGATIVVVVFWCFMTFNTSGINCMGGFTKLLCTLQFFWARASIPLVYGSQCRLLYGWHWKLVRSSNLSIVWLPYNLFAILKIRWSSFHWNVLFSDIRDSLSAWIFSFPARCLAWISILCVYARLKIALVRSERSLIFPPKWFKCATVVTLSDSTWINLFDKSLTKFLLLKIRRVTPGSW